MARTYDDITFTLPDGTTTTLSRHSDDYIRLKRTLYKIRQRCTNPNDKSYPHYGGRGIKCSINTVAELVQTLGLKPPGYSIDRIDNDGDYSLDNIRWADYTTQIRNRRISYSITINDETKSIYDWFELLQPNGLCMNTIRDRYQCGVRGIALFYPKHHPDVVSQYKRVR